MKISFSQFGGAVSAGLINFKDNEKLASARACGSGPPCRSPLALTSCTDDNDAFSPQCEAVIRSGHTLSHAFSVTLPQDFPKVRTDISEIVTTWEFMFIEHLLSANCEAEDVMGKEAQRLRCRGRQTGDRCYKQVSKRRREEGGEEAWGVEEGPTQSGG